MLNDRFGAHGAAEGVDVASVAHWAEVYTTVAEAVCHHVSRSVTGRT